MRRHLFLLAFCISCGGDPGKITREETLPEPVHHLSGLLLDSMLNDPVVGVRVLVGDSSVLSDSEGRFRVGHRSGDLPLVVDDYRYEAYNTVVSLHSDYQIEMRLRGEAPYVTECRFGTDSLTATVIDLQGRKTINRRSQSTVQLVDNGSTYIREANTWSWTPVDFFTWLAHVPRSGVPADTAVWRMEDADGHVRIARCVDQPPPCIGCAGRNE